MTLRPATKEEWELYARSRPSHVQNIWSCIVEEGTEVKGHGFISRIDDTVWLHDLEVWADDPLAVARLFQRGRRFLREAGIDDVYTHVKSGSATHRFYLKHGFEEGELVLRGSI